MIAATPIAASSAAVAHGTTTTSLRQRAATLAKQITLDSRQLQITGEQYDRANVTYAKAEHQLAVLRSQMHEEDVRLRQASARMRTAAVSAYVYGVGAQSEASAVLSGSAISNVNTLATYASIASLRLHTAVTSVVRARSALSASELQQETIANAAKHAETTAMSTRRQARAIEINARSALSQVRGQLAALIAEQAAAAARAAAAAAAAARSAQLRSEEQAQAQAQANLAQTIADNNPTSTPSQTSTSPATPSATVGAGPTTPVTPSQVATSIASAAAAAQSAAQSASAIGAPTVILGPSTPAGLAAVSAAETELGVPYVWGGASRTIGFDCSGLTMVAWQAAGVTLTHSAYDQYLSTTRIPIVNQTITLEPGDLLFYYFPNDGTDPVTHVTMYVGSGPFGSNTVIAAPETGEDVMYQPLYWGGFVGAGRP